MKAMLSNKSDFDVNLERLLAFSLKEDFERRLADIRTYGIHSMAYSAMQPEIKIYRDSSFEGFIPYMSVWGIDYVLSDPITPIEQYEIATLSFLEFSKSSVFCQISYNYAKLLSNLGYKVNGFGIENFIDVQKFKVGWRDKKCLKSYLSKLDKQGHHAFEMNPKINQINEINDQWISSKQQSKELKFMARPFVGINEKDVRSFYLIQNNQILGFCTFDPIYSDDYSGKVSSYTLQHLRVADRAPLGSQDFLILNALSQFKLEGIKEISLGLSPLYKRKNSDLRSSKLVDMVFSMIYSTNAFYNYRTIGQHKDHYKANQTQTFVAFSGHINIGALCGLLKVNNLI
jgi:lysylphosphatidylglycerol synthetase-like protein (DUF2156 family)